MRIAAIQDHLRTGGTEAQFLDLTRRWADDGHEVRRIVFRRGGALARMASEGPDPVYLQPGQTPFNWWAPGLTRLLRKLAPEKVICFGRNAHWSLARALSAGQHPGLVATLRGGRKIPGGYRRLLGEAEKVVVNSAYARERAIEAGVGAGAISVIENGCRLAGVSLPEPSAARSALGVDGSGKVFLCMGSFVPGKAQHRLLDVWDGMPPQIRKGAFLWFVGDGPCRRRLQRRAAAGPDPNRIRFWGDRTDPERFLAASDVTVSVSREESSPNALVESLWFGVPVLATRCAGVADIVESDRDGRVYPDSAEGLAALRRTMERVVTEGLPGAGLEAGVSPRVRSRFDPAARARDYLAIFERMQSFTPGNPSKASP